ncbi:ALF repeat-containing protein [Streptomyces sp. NPDC006733]|uniref:ALF repeat-containing protein n=1 Tax=Streptomyces sp. NPDC006733 TaxID=3155460 RepID=UPI0033D2FFFC
MEMARISAIAAAVAIAPAVLFSSAAVAADGTQPVPTSAPDTVADAKPVKGRPADDVRVAISRILADKNTGRRVYELAQKALDGTEEDQRYFLEVGQYKARLTDDRVRVSQIINTGGPEVRKAGKGALRIGTAESIKQFLEVGQYTARAMDKAAEDAAHNKPTPTPGTGGKPTTGNQPKPATGSDGKPAVVVTDPPSSVAPAGSNGTELASTGAGDTPRWAVGGAVVALGAGAGLVLVNRRRSSVER